MILNEHSFTNGTPDEDGPQDDEGAHDYGDEQPSISYFDQDGNEIARILLTGERPYLPPEWRLLQGGQG